MARASVEVMRTNYETWSSDPIELRPGVWITLKLQREIDGWSFAWWRRKGLDEEGGDDVAPGASIDRFETREAARTAGLNHARSVLDKLTEPDYAIVHQLINGGPAASGLVDVERARELATRGWVRAWKADDATIYYANLETYPLRARDMLVAAGVSDVDEAWERYVETVDDACGDVARVVLERPW